jgi:hypothetical protein
LIIEQETDMRDAAQHHVRTISYDPDSIRIAGRRCEVPNPAWILCRTRYQYPILDDVTLRRWTVQGRVEPRDFLVSPRLDVCIQARDIAELKDIFRAKTARQLERASWRLVAAGLILFAVVPLFGVVLFASAIVTAISSIRQRGPITR